jgi:hypothetical protein
LEHLEAMVPASASFHAFGPKLSFGFVPSRSQLAPSDWDGFASDILVWEQQGCLSPQVLFVEGKEESVRDLAEKLVSGAESLGERWKRVPLPRDRARQQWHHMEIELQSGQTPTFIEGSQLSIVIADLIYPKAFSTPGFIQIIPVGDAEVIQAHLKPFAGEIGSCAIPLSSLSQQLIQQLKTTLSAEKIVRFGELQAPVFLG